MLGYFLSNYDAFFFLSLLLSIPIFLIVLASPILVFHWVFRNPHNREKDYKFIRASSPRLSPICIATSLIVIAFAKSGWLFENQSDIKSLLFISVMVAALALILGVLALPRWQGFVVSFVAFVNYFFVWFFVLFIESQNRFHNK